MSARAVLVVDEWRPEEGALDILGPSFDADVALGVLGASWAAAAGGEAAERMVALAGALAARGARVVTPFEPEYGSAVCMLRDGDVVYPVCAEGAVRSVAVFAGLRAAAAAAGVAIEVRPPHGMQSGFDPNPRHRHRPHVLDVRSEASEAMRAVFGIERPLRAGHEVAEALGVFAAGAGAIEEAGARVARRAARRARAADAADLEAALLASLGSPPRAPGGGTGGTAAAEESRGGSRAAPAAAAAGDAGVGGDSAGSSGGGGAAAAGAGRASPPVPPDAAGSDSEVHIGGSEGEIDERACVSAVRRAVRDNGPSLALWFEHNYWGEAVPAGARRVFVTFAAAETLERLAGLPQLDLRDVCVLALPWEDPMSSYAASRREGESRTDAYGRALVDLALRAAALFRWVPRTNGAAAGGRADPL